MDTLASGAITGLCFIYTIALFILYHKVFTVYYFDLPRGIIKELIGSFLGGLILSAITVKLYIPLTIILIIVGLAVSSKQENEVKKKLVIGIFLALAVITLITGHKFNSTEKGTSEANEAKSSSIVYENTENTNNSSSTNTERLVKPAAAATADSISLPDEEPYAEEQEMSITIDESDDITNFGIFEAEELIGGYLCAYIEDLNCKGYQYLRNYVEEGSPLEEALTDYVITSDLTEELLDFEITNVDGVDDETYHVTSVEQYDVYNSVSGANYYVKQKCVYKVKLQEDGSWRISDYVGKIEQLDKQVYE